MKNIKIFTAVIVLATSIFLGGIKSTQAATLSLSSATDVLRIGDTLEVFLKIDSEGAGINAVQGTLQYPKDILQATKVDKFDSVFDFWLQEPSFSNETGRVSFVGGSTVGSVGKSLQALKVIFTVKGSGRAELTVTDAAVTASDGSGTNVLSTLHSLVVNSVPKTGAPTAAVVPTLIPAPVQITRPAVVASGLPSKPDVSIPLYPNPSGWSNRTDTFITNWKLPADVSAVSVALDQNVSYSGTSSEGLFDSKVFPAITRDGEWYVHVRFRNNIGWGPVAAYRIAIDTHPPVPFIASVIEGLSTDSPTPTLKFDTKDSLSSLKEYTVSVDNGDPIVVDVNNHTGMFKLAPLAPGKRHIVVRAVDNADNSTENDVNLEIIPITSPVIMFVTQDLFSNKQTGVAVKGSALADINILITLHQQSAVIARATARSDKNGNWQHLFDNQLINGSYAVSAQSQDARGALSLVVESPEIRVQSEPILQLGSITLGAGGAAILLLIILVGAFSGGAWYWRKRQETLALRVVFAETEITKIFKLIMEDVKKVSDALKTATTADDEYAVTRLEENIKKMEAYLKKGVDKIQK